jgi:hypothetical protein
LNNSGVFLWRAHRRDAISAATQEVVLVIRTEATMRRKLVLGIGLAALVGGGVAAQEFASERGASKGAPLTLPSATRPGPVVGGFQPATPASPSLPTSPAAPGAAPLYGSPTRGGAYVPPADALRPASYEMPTPGAPAMGAPGGNFQPAPSFTAIPVDAEIPTAIPKDHQWLLRPEHGPWFILVKSYVRPSKDSRAAKEERERGERGMTARELAEGLAGEIRETFRVQAFLYEYISEERKAEHRAVIAAKQKAASEYVAQVRALEQRAKLQGLDFDLPDNKLLIRRHETRDHIGVLVGGFQSEADAIKALGVLKKWPAPKNELLMDGGAIVKTDKDGKSVIEKTRINPYATAFVVANPAAVRAGQPAAPRPALDPFVVKLNDGQPYSLLEAKKNWTLVVKSFNSPVEIVNKNSDRSLMRKFGFGKGSDVLAAGAEQAEAMAKLLRAMKGPGGESLNLEAFVLHTRTASLVTIGQFDGLDDPAMHATRRLLASMKLHVTEDQTGQRQATSAPSLFDTILPMPIPKP